MDTQFELTQEEKSRELTGLEDVWRVLRQIAMDNGIEPPSEPWRSVWVVGFEATDHIRFVRRVDFERAHSMTVIAERLVDVGFSEGVTRMLVAFQRGERPVFSIKDGQLADCIREAGWALKVDVIDILLFNTDKWRGRAIHSRYSKPFSKRYPPLRKLGV